MVAITSQHTGRGTSMRRFLVGGCLWVGLSKFQFAFSLKGERALYQISFGGGHFKRGAECRSFIP